MNQIHRNMIGIAIAAGLLSGCLLLKNEERACQDCLAEQAKERMAIQASVLGVMKQIDESPTNDALIHCPEKAVTVKTLEAAATLAAAFAIFVYVSTVFGLLVFRSFKRLRKITRK
jgi:hypothetical protein